MKYILQFVLLMSLLPVAAQRPMDQYSLEAGYGLGLGSQPQVSEFGHFEVGFRYMMDDMWGIKFDFGHDGFSPSTPDAGTTNYNRASAHVVHNLGRTLAIPDNTNGRINMLSHAGLGYSALKSSKYSGIDSIGNVVLGVTPQFYLIENLAFHVDASLVINVSQNYELDGTYPNPNKKYDTFTGTLVNVSAGLTFYFGRNSSNSDWR